MPITTCWWVIIIIIIIVLTHKHTCTHTNTHTHSIITVTDCNTNPLQVPSLNGMVAGAWLGACIAILLLCVVSHATLHPAHTDVDVCRGSVAVALAVVAGVWWMGCLLTQVTCFSVCVTLQEKRTSQSEGLDQIRGALPEKVQLAFEPFLIQGRGGEGGGGGV